MFRILPRISIPHLLRPGPERIDESFAEQPLDQGMRNRVLTLSRRAGMDPALAGRLADAYAAADETARVEVSRPDQVTGLRRLILMGPAYHRATSSVTIGFGEDPPVRTDDTRAPLTLIGVTGDGLLFRRGLYTAEGAPSAREGLRIARHEPERLLPGVGAADPGLNRHNGGASVQVRDATDQVLRLTSAVLSKEEREALPYRFIMGIEHVTRVRIARRVALARFALNDALDPDLLRLMRGCALQSLREAEWVCGAVSPDPGRPGPGRWFGAPLAALNDRDLSRARVQAVRAYPAMAKLLLNNPELRRAIDAREPLAPAIAAHLGVEEAGVRLLNGVTWQRAAVPPTGPAQGLARLARVPRDLAPTRRAEHRQLPLIVGFADLLQEPLPETMRRFAKGGSPYRFGEELKRVSPGDVRDAAEYLVDKLLIPARLHALRRMSERDGVSRNAMALMTDRPERIRSLLASMGVRDLFDLSDRWHRNLERHEDRLITLRSEVSWDPFVGLLDLGEGVRARELAGAGALQTQGKREGHCVGGYTDKLLRAGPNRIPLIFSLERDGAVLGTAELSLRRRDPARERGATERPWATELIQNRARRNGPVCEAAGRAAEALCRALEGAAPERAEPYVSGLGRVRTRRSRHGGLQAHLRSAGYDLWEPGRLEAAWTELSGYLPRGVRRAGLEGLIRAETDLARQQERAGPAEPDQARLAVERTGLRHAEGGSQETGGRIWAEDRATPFWERDARALAALRLPEPEGRQAAARAEPEEEEWMPF